MKYIDAEKLLAEIEKLYEIARNASYNGEVEGEMTAYDKILSFITSLQQEQPSLPSDLDEAAEEAYPKMSRLSEPHGVIPADNKTHYLGDANEDNRVAFKAGAEWMAGQGVNTDFEVCKLANRAWLTPIDEKKFAQDIFDNFAAGDNVVVQIRKK